MNSNWVITKRSYLNEDEVSCLRRTAEDLAIIGLGRKLLIPPRDWMVIDLATSTGLRVSEISNLKESDLFIGRGEFQLIVTNGKCGRTRTVFFDPSLKAHLKKYLEWKKSVNKNGDYIFFSKRNSKICVEALEKIFNKLKKKAGLSEYYTFHSMRHTYATHLYAKTRDLRLVQRQLGHSSPVITTLYADLIDTQLAKAFSLPLYGSGE